MTTRATARQRHLQEQAKRRPMMWLDALPLEISTHIALYLNKGLAPEFQDRNLALLNLARTSVRQQNAALEATAYSFELQYDSPADWNIVFKNNIRHVSTKNFRGDKFLDLLKAGTLETAAVSNRSVHLKLIARLQHLRELTVEFSVRSPAHYLLSALHVLDLKKLAFNCSWYHSRGVCVFELFPTPVECNQLSALCPNLAELEFSCDCSKQDHDLSRFVRAFPQTRSLTFNLQVSDDVVSMLQGLDSVTLKTSQLHCGLRHPAQFKLAAQIGNPITGIVTSSHFDGAWWVPRDPLIGAAGVAELGKCPRLAHLDMYIENGGEKVFPRLTELRSLRLQWDPSDMYEWIGLEPVSPHYSPHSDFYMRIVADAPGLQELCLFRAKISLADLDFILKALGGGLRVFGTSIEGQSEHAGERLLSLVDMVTRYNSSIRRLCLFYHDAGVTKLIGHETICLAPSTKRILLAFKRLQRRCPQLDINKLFSWLGDWLDESPRRLIRICEGL